MLIYVILIILFFIGIPVLLFNSILKLDEKQYDVILESYGTAGANKQRVKDSKPSTVTVKKNAQPAPTKPVFTKIQAYFSRLKETLQSALANFKAKLPKKTADNKTAIPLGIKMKAAVKDNSMPQIKGMFFTTTNYVKDMAMKVRKKFPGYVYPSRAAMLEDKRNKELRPK